MSETNEPETTPFGRWVLRVLKKRGATYRSQRQRTGIPHSTVLGWVQGIPPRMESVIRFAEGMEADRNEALLTAGYATADTLENLALLVYARLMRRYGSDTRNRLIIESHYRRVAEQIERGEADPSTIATFGEVAEEEILALPAEGTPLEQLGYQEDPLETIRTAARTLIYDEDLEGVTVAGYRGSEFPPEDAAALDRIARAFAAEHRRKQGRD